jgi:hypothetical protein
MRASIGLGHGDVGPEERSSRKQGCSHEGLAAVRRLTRGVSNMCPSDASTSIDRIAHCATNCAIEKRLFMRSFWLLDPRGASISKRVARFVLRTVFRSHQVFSLRPFSQIPQRTGPSGLGGGCGSSRASWHLKSFIYLDISSRSGGTPANGAEAST